ncbi:MAG: pyridoxal phosphate-dependent aminotransferase [Sporomusaceae bacterium]|nr:pyridoxal phosphate-dependent aminotransferase [Sporomusaceae bacterium]
MAKPGASIVSAVEGSTTVAISDRARQLQQEGIDIINLGSGDPDFSTPQHIQDAAIESMKRGFTHYVDSKGTPQLRRAIAEKYRREAGLSYDPNKEIIATASGKVALYISLAALVDPGDEVLILEPAWVSYRPIVQLLNGTPVGVPLRFENNFLISDSVIEQYVTPKTKAIILNSPSNPTGRVLSDAELESIARIAQAHDLWVLTDDIYEKIIYDGRVHKTLAALPGMKERTIIVNGMSKAYAMTGWRLGYLAGPAAIVAEILKIQQHFVTCAASFTQVAGVAALEGGESCINAMAAEYDKRRRSITAALNRIAGICCPLPEGAFYFFPRVDYKGMDSFELATYLLDAAHVAVTPGIAFGKAGEGCIRLTYAISLANLQEAIRRIERAFK